MKKILNETKFGPDEFQAIIKEMGDLHFRKNHDYAGGNYLSDFIAARRLGIIPWKAAVRRMQEKMSRLENFCVQDELKVKDESVEDTLKDASILAILALILYRHKK